MERNVPKLRFKGFSDEWKKEKLDKLGVFFKGNGISKADLSQQGKPCILYGELYTKYSEVIDKVYSKTNLNIKNPTLSKVNDVIIPSSGETSIDIATASCVQQNDILLGGDLNVFRPNKANGIFISYQLNSAKRREIAKIAQGASVVHVYNEQLKKVKVKLPSLQEQERIANFLTKIDKIIEKQEEKVKNLEKYKKGMMQKIFSQEIRFKDENGNEYPEWEEKRLQDISFKITEKNKGFKIKNIISNSAKNGLISQRDFFDKDIANISNIDGYYVIQPGDFVYNPRKSYEAPYGPINSYKLDSEGVVSPLYFCFRINGEVNKCYIEYYFKSTKWYRYIYMNSDQGVRHDRVSIKDSEMMKMNIKLPVMQEQNKIAKFLLGINNLLDKEKEKLQELKQWKKGLLQNMFV